MATVNVRHQDLVDAEEKPVANQAMATVSVINQNSVTGASKSVDVTNQTSALNHDVTAASVNHNQTSSEHVEIHARLDDVVTSQGTTKVETMRTPAEHNTVESRSHVSRSAAVANSSRLYSDDSVFASTLPHPKHTHHAPRSVVSDHRPLQASVSTPVSRQYVSNEHLLLHHDVDARAIQGGRYRSLVTVSHAGSDIVSDLDDDVLTSHRRTHVSPSHAAVRSSASSHEHATLASEAVRPARKAYISRSLTDVRQAGRPTKETRHYSLKRLQGQGPMR